MNATIHHGDCLDVLRQMPDNSVHAIVTDPPYGLSNTTPEQVADTIVRWVNGDREHLPSGRGFMGKEWDGFVPPVAVWDEAMRVLKPGGHVLAFAGTRTMDLMTLGLRLAGFDIRESIAWMYGSGMPKSHNVSKAIDKRPGVAHHAEFGKALREAMTAAGYTNTFDVAEKVIGRRTGAVANWIKYQFPESKWWPGLRDLLGMDEAKWGPIIAEANREVTGRHLFGLATGSSGLTVHGEGKERRDIPATAAAKQWEGWGSATKPAHEPIVMARKPFKGTLAANVLEHGTGAINVDATRIGGESGRWPANVILDEHCAGVLDQQSGVLTSGWKDTDVPRNPDSVTGNFGAGEVTGAHYSDSGGASRFFYVAKASKRERPDVDGIKHPTVKPLALMRWLVRLVTPPNGIVLDPFAGSGTTIEAAMLEGFDCIGIEREAEYLPLIQHRIDRATEQLRTEQEAQAEAPDQGAFPLEDIA